MAIERTGAGNGLGRVERRDLQRIVPVELRAKRDERISAAPARSHSYTLRCNHFCFFFFYRLESDDGRRTRAERQPRRSAIVSVFRRI